MAVFWFEGECLACTEWHPLTERHLCAACDDCFERDLVRLERWESSGLGQGLTTTERQALRERIRREYGVALEILRPGDGWD